MFHNFKSLGILAIAYQLSTLDGYCCDKSLETDANACFTKLWSGVAISQDRIKESLNFLEDAALVDQKYGKPDAFKELLRSSTTSLPQQNFTQFSRDCEVIFNESDTPEAKIALHIFFEKVGEKYSNELRRLTRLKTLEKEAEAQKAGAQTYPNNSFSDVFANADKGIQSH